MQRARTKSGFGEVQLSTIILLMALSIAFFIGDYITTSLLVRGDISHESNPLVAWLFYEFGHAGVLVAKVVGFVLIGLAVYFVDARFGSSKLKDGAVIALVFLYTFIVLNNIFVILSLSSIGL